MIRILYKNNLINLMYFSIFLYLYKIRFANILKMNLSYEEKVLIKDIFNVRVSKE